MIDVTAEQLIKSKTKLYSSYIAYLASIEKGLEELDEWRYTLREMIAERLKDEKKTYVTHDELKKLMKWKITKGKYRPSLPKLISQNDPDDVIKTTTEAFHVILDAQNDEILSEEEYVQLVRKALKTVTGLRGVGPATGSLILSLLSEVTHLAPCFFSDEAAYYIFKRSDGPQKLKYSLAEYVLYLRSMYQLNPNFEHNFDDLEMGAWSEEMANTYGEVTSKKRSPAENNLAEAPIKRVRTNR